MSKKPKIGDAAVAQWLESHFFNRNKGTMRKSEIWKTLKINLKLLGNWKDAPRGDRWAAGRAKFMEKRRSESD